MKPETYQGRPCKQGHSGLRYKKGGKCIICATIRAKCYYSRNRQKGQAARKEWRKNNPEKVRISQAKFLRLNPEHNIKYSAQYQEDRRQALKERDKNNWRVRAGLPQPTRPMPDACEKCGKAFDTLHLDHCHDTGKFRGWLCFGCNTGLGKLGDNIAGVQAALDYLQRAYAS